MLVLRWASFRSKSRMLFRAVSELRGPLTEAGEEEVRGGEWGYRGGEVAEGRVEEGLTRVPEWVVPWAMWVVLEGL